MISHTEMLRMMNLALQKNPPQVLILTPKHLLQIHHLPSPHPPAPKLTLMQRRPVAVKHRSHKKEMLPKVKARVRPPHPESLYQCWIQSQRRKLRWRRVTVCRKSLQRTQSRLSKHQRRTLSLLAQTNLTAAPSVERRTPAAADSR